MFSLKKIQLFLSMPCIKHAKTKAPTMNTLPSPSHRVSSKLFTGFGLAGILLLLTGGCTKSADPFHDGVEALNRNDYDSAIAAFSDAIHVNPKSAEAYYN